MNLDEIRDFLEFCRYMNFTKAAKHLHMTQPALSYRISSLEKSLGVTLVNRTKPIRLTPEGIQFFEDIRPVINHLDEILDRYASKPTKQLIPANSQIVIREPLLTKGRAYSLFTTLLSEFQEEHPDIAIKFFSGSKDNFIDDLYHGTVDCALTVSFDGDTSIIEKNSPERAITQDHSCIEYVPIAEIPLVVVMDNTCPLANKESLSLEDLGGYAINCIYEAAYDEYLYALEANLKRYGLKNEVRPKFSIPDQTLKLDEVFFSAPDFPFDRSCICRSFIEDPQQLIHVAFNNAEPKKEAILLLKEHFRRNYKETKPDSFEAGLNETDQ